MVTQDDTTINDRLAHLVETCDGGPTFKAELKELAAELATPAREEITDNQHDTTAPASDALAAWDKLFNERETLNQNLDFSNDAAYHEPEGKLPAETVRELATTALLLEQTNALIDKANERQSRRPTDEANTLREEIADTILAKTRRMGFTAQHNSDGEFPYQLVGPRVTVEGLAEQVAELGKRSTQSALATFVRIQDEHAKKSPQICAIRLRQFSYDVSENLAASMNEDGFTVTKTWTPKGLRYFLAEREFMESLLSDDDAAPANCPMESRK